MRDGVALLHGVLRTRWSMARLARRLEAEGRLVANIDYPSRRHPLERLAEIVHPEISALAARVEGRLHFVGHSMGGLLIRAYLARFRPANLGRVVMIGTPNRGSELADLLADLRLYRALFGPAGRQLVTDQSGFADLFGPVDYEVGIIAGRLSANPLGEFIFGGPNDGKVSVARARLDGARAFAALPVSHTFAMESRTVWRHVSTFLDTGAFPAREAPARLRRT